MSKNRLNVNIQIVHRLSALFREKNWPMGQTETGEDEELFDKFCDLMISLDRKEQDLILNLTSDFERFTYFDYPSLMNDVFHKIDASILYAHKSIYLIPLVSPSDLLLGKIKSGEHILYCVLHIVLPRYIDSSSQKIFGVSDIMKFNTLHQDREDSLIIFIDDFIGTGDTACEVLKEYSKHTKKGEDVLVVTAVALEMGIDAIRNLGFEVASSLVRRRGISDSDRIENKEEALIIMDNIENRLRLRKEYRRGYKQSEALVKMVRTPNNTFPVYWCTETSGGNRWPAPFPRY